MLMSTKTMSKVLLTAVLSVLVLAVNAVSETANAQVPVIVNVPANVVFAPITGVDGIGAEENVTANTQKIFNIVLSTDYNPWGTTSLPPGQVNAGVQFKYSRGSVILNLPARAYSNAVISLHSLNGKRVLSGNASASNAQVFSISRDIPVGVYVLSVKGANGKSFATRLAHNGEMLNINAAFVGEGYSALSKEASDYGRWTITVSADGYHTQIRTFKPVPGTNPAESFTLIQPASNPKTNFAETVSGSSSSGSGSSSSVSFEMIYIPGGTFTIGCTANSGCPRNAEPVEGVKVSSYYIGKTEVTYALWNSVVGGASCNQYYPRCTDSYTNMTWYDAMEFACKLSEKTGRNYRMQTEAEFEYAARNHFSKLEKIDGSEEWAYNSWSSTHAGGTDPVGQGSGAYTQKTRRDTKDIGDYYEFGRLIRSIEGIGPTLRLVVSADADYPPGYVNPCNLHMPLMGDEPANSYRDLRWVTGSDAQWEPTGTIAIGSFKYRVWDDGTALMTPSYGNPVPGQWFTSNNITFVFVPNSGTTIRRYAYIFLDASQGSLISDQGYMNGFIGRIEKVAASNVAKPTISGLKSGEELAIAQTNYSTDYKMVDMTNIPQSARQQDARLLDGLNQGWFQDNRQAGGVHHYRKDVDEDEFRFTVNQPGLGRTYLATGTWFTLNNTFLRVTHKDGYVAEYLYAVTSDGTFYHNSFMGYERGDFRMFEKKANAPQNADLWSGTCQDLCSGEIPKGQAPASMYVNDKEKGQSTFVPAPCPEGGCQ